MDIGVGPALLARVAGTGTGGWLRLYQPAAAMAFTGRDAVSPGFGQAVEISAASGFPPVLRAPGGRAVAFHDGSLCLDLAVAAREPRAGTIRRFAALSELLVEALAAVDVRAQLGPVRDEYCPGEYSINVGGKIKIAGIAQRVVRGGWLLGAVVFVAGADRVRDVIDGTYRALGVACDPGSIGAVSDVAPRVGVGDITDAITAAFARRGRLQAARCPAGLLARARLLAPDHPRLAASPTSAAAQ